MRIKIINGNHYIIYREHTVPIILNDRKLTIDQKFYIILSLGTGRYTTHYITPEEHASLFSQDSVISKIAKEIILNKLNLNGN